MNTDTPRTDDEESRIQCDLSSMKLDDWGAAYHEMKEHAQELEREINEMTTKLRIALHEAINRPKGIVPHEAEEFYDQDFYSTTAAQ
jgi:hypothetical protein